MVEKAESLEPNGDGNKVLTRNDQLLLKAASKEKRSRKGKKGQNGKKARKGKKSKKDHAKAVKPKTKKAKLSRKRKVLKAYAGAVDDASEHMAAKPCAVPSASSSNSRLKTPAGKGIKVKKTIDKAPRGKKATDPKPKASPKRKASPKTKAAPKAKGRPRGPKNDVNFVDRQRESHLFSAAMVEDFEAFAKKFDISMDVKSTKFKEFARSFQETSYQSYQYYRLNIYWTRTSCGVTEKASYKDAVTFSFNSSSAHDVYKIAVAIRCAMIAAT